MMTMWNPEREALDREALGLGDLSLREIKTLLHDGWVSPTWARVIR